MRALVVLFALLLAGCSSPEAAPARHYADAVIASADFAPPIEREDVERAAAALGWHTPHADPFPQGFSLAWQTPQKQVVVVQHHPTRENWSMTRFYNLTGGRAESYASPQEASAAATAAWPTFEADFEAFVRAFEGAGGWQRVRIRHACLCAEG